MSSSRWRDFAWWPASSMLVLMLAGLGLPSIGRTETEPPVAYRLLSAELGGRKARLHQFRVRVPDVRTDVFDLDFRIPVHGSLGETAFTVNGGYWEYHLDKPRMIGWVVSGGKQLSPLRKKLDGGVLLIRDGRAHVVKSAGLDPKPEGVELAVQCKPRLVEAGKVVPRLDAALRAARTAACTRDGGTTLDFVLTDPRDRGITLAQLAGWLAADGCTDALNLDGGPSTAAAFRKPDGVLRIGAGVGLPYAIRFSAR